MAQWMDLLRGPVLGVIMMIMLLRSVLAAPILWSFVGSQAAFLFNVKPDLGLLVAGVVAMGLFIWPGHAKNTSAMRFFPWTI